MPNINNSLSLDTAARSDPRDNRLIFSWIENGQCNVEVQDCFDIGALTYEVNGDSTEIVCTNLATGENEVIGSIDAGSTRKATFDLSRYLPESFLSAFLRRVEINCGLRLYIARGTECLDPFNVNEFRVLDLFGEITFGNYTRTEMRHKDKSQAAAIMEGSTVTAFNFRQVGLQSFAVRGEVATDPLVGITLCDKRSCGGQCEDDSDGCQKWLAVDENGQVTYTTNQFFAEAIVPNLPTLANGTITDICCIRGQLVLVERDAEVDAGPPIVLGTQLHVADLDTILNGGTPTWNTIALDTEANNIDNQNTCQLSPDGFTLWMVGDNGSIYQYNPTRGTITPVPGIAGLAANFQRMDILGETIVIVADNDVVLRSQDGGRSFQQVEVIDPVTGVASVGLTFTSVDILSDVNWTVGTSDDRTLFTLDDGASWANQVIPGAGAGAIEDIHFDNNLVGYMTRTEGGVSSVYKTYYGNCEPWLPMPESNDPLPDNQGITRIINCPDDPNVTVAIGANDAGAGLILVGTSEYR